MFDIGWQEIFVIGMVTVVVLGPKELPRAIRTVTGLVRKARLMAYEFQRGVDEMVRESELDDLRKQAEELARTDIGAEVKRVVDPDGDLQRDFATRAWEADLDAMKEQQTIAPPPSEPAALPVPAEQPLDSTSPSVDTAAPAPDEISAPRRDQSSG
jgi:sec-independent protein translocase protein TatB